MHKILVLAVKGGTGKSTVTAGLGKALAAKGLRVGLMDLDISGANLPAALGMSEPFPHPEVDLTTQKLHPVCYAGCEIFSLAFRYGSSAVLKGGGDRTVTAFGETHLLKGTGRVELVKQMINNVAFSELDYLLFDLPPSTGDEVLSLFEEVNDIHGCILVCQPTNLAVEDMVRALDMIEEKRLPLLGMVGNMVEAICPHCGEKYYPFTAPGVDLPNFCKEKGIPYLMGMPMTPVRPVLDECLVRLAETIQVQVPVKIWDKGFKSRLERGILHQMIKVVIREQLHGGKD